MSQNDASAAPAGFRRLPLDFGFMKVNGPLYGRREPDGQLTMAFQVEDRHTNPMGICHGGMLTTFADMVLGFVASIAAGGKRFVPTVNMTCDFIAPAPLGAWVEGRGRSLRTTRNLSFAECWLSVGPSTVLRANGILKIPAEENAFFDVGRLFA